MTQAGIGEAPLGLCESVAYQKALEVLAECLCCDGFLASSCERDNYRRVWARDGAVAGLAALLTGDGGLIRGFRCTLQTLARHQGPHGEIPANVEAATSDVNFGGTTGRVDADLWFIIACGQYWRATGDDDFLISVLTPLERVRFLLGAWEFNNRGLLYVPFAGDWADEFVQHGYVLYDQLLYLQAQRELCAIHRHLHGQPDQALEQRVVSLRNVIRSNFWIDSEESQPQEVYHDVLFERGRSAAAVRPGAYWMPFFSPVGYGYRFDTLANVLVSLLGVADDGQREKVDRFIAETLTPPMLLPAFHPVITPDDREWVELEVAFSYSFKNRPHEYQNGGLWPMITGFYAADLAQRGKRELAERYLEGIHQANQLEMDGQAWGFPEYVHGVNHTPGGTRHLCWSAAAAVIGAHALQGESVFRGDECSG